MKLNITFIALLILTATGYVIGYTGDPFLFIVVFPPALLTIFLVIISPAANIIWNFLPLKIKKMHENHKKRFDANILFCFTVFFFGGWAINHYYLPENFSIVKLLVNMGILLFSILLGWSLIRPNKKTVLLSRTTTCFLSFLAAKG